MYHRFVLVGVQRQHVGRAVGPVVGRVNGAVEALLAPAQHRLVSRWHREVQGAVALSFARPLGKM